ncbi:hypothetical protein D3C74_307840 [compost metagenome]
MIIQVLDPKCFLCFGHTRLSQRYGFHLDVYRKVFLWYQTLHKTVSCIIQICRFLSLSRDNEWRTRLINQDGVHLINDTEKQWTLYHLLFV